MVYELEIEMTGAPLRNLRRRDAGVTRLRARMPKSNAADALSTI
jgi:hypothetical protein